MSMWEPQTQIAPQSRQATLRAWRVEFVENLATVPDGVETIEIAEPRAVTALVTSLAPSDALKQGGQEAPAGSLTVIWVPLQANIPSSVELEIDEWTARGSMERKEVTARAEVRSLRVVWRESRAVIYADEGDMGVALNALVRFSVAQREALALEATMASTWATIEADSPLTHALKVHDLKRQRHVNQMTEVTTHMKMHWLRIFRSLEQLNPPLENASKRIFAELASATFLYDRMETLEPTIQFALDHYEISNTRLIDMYVARIDRVNSIVGYGIVTILLLVQIWIMLFEVSLQR